MSPDTPCTDRYVVMGNPIEHSRSPWIHARFAELTGQPLTYGKQLTPLDGFATTLATLRQEGVRGCNVTVPFKFEAFAAATRHTERATLAGACNTLAFNGDEVLGDNTDGVGLVRDITANAGMPLRGARVLLLGAGGAAAGVLGPLLAEQPRELVVCNRTTAKAEALVASHAAHAANHKCELKSHTSQALEGFFDVILNATASSLGGGDVPAPASVLRPGALVVDLMYGPAAQPFLAWAAAHGATGRDGLGMLVEQAAAAFELWRGVRPPGAQVLAELSALLSPPTTA
jgi:shikimate dehydrogenase